MFFSAALIALFAGSQLVAGHSAIIKAVGDAGGAGSAIGVDPATPRDGTKRNPFQQDATRFRGASAATCGETLAGGTNSLAAGTTTMMQQTGGTLPQISQGGSLNMTVHQVNADGGGPYSCAINSDGTATTWQNIQVTQNLQGNNHGRNPDTAMMDLPLNVQIPASQSCTGTVAGQDNVCVVRCMNNAKAAGPFGGCVPVQMAGAAPAATAATAATKRSVLVRSAKFNKDSKDNRDEINAEEEEEDAYDY